MVAEENLVLIELLLCVSGPRHSCAMCMLQYVCRGGAACDRPVGEQGHSQDASQWGFSFNTSTDIDLDYLCNTQTLQKCFICTGCSFGLSTL